MESRVCCGEKDVGRTAEPLGLLWGWIGRY
jgi:hypothetical protein